ncbi:MAG: hypothetical protein MK110_06755 [Fuerstiella sp.]|nr:hypothetical protein [Fuerstiella sp.]
MSATHDAFNMWDDEAAVVEITADCDFMIYGMMSWSRSGWGKKELRARGTVVFVDVRLSGIVRNLRSVDVMYNRFPESLRVISLANAYEVNVAAQKYMRHVPLTVSRKSSVVLRAKASDVLPAIGNSTNCSTISATTACSTSASRGFRPG